MKMLGAFTFLVGFLGAAPAAYAQSPWVVYKNNQGVDSIREEKVGPALDRFSDALADDGSNSVLHFNLGLAFEKGKEADKALLEYQTAIKAAGTNSEVKFMAQFNRARLLGELKRIDDALEGYQEALKLRPESIEVKTNIEMLLQNGGGKGDGENKDGKQGKDNKDGKGGGEGDKDKKDQQQQQQPQGPPKEPPKPQPKPFKSEALTPHDVKNILDELKRQEDQIRQRLNNKPVKEKPVEKDW